MRLNLAHQIRPKCVTALSQVEGPRLQLNLCLRPRNEVCAQPFAQARVYWFVQTDSALATQRQESCQHVTQLGSVICQPQTHKVRMMH